MLSITTGIKMRVVQSGSAPIWVLRRDQSFRPAWPELLAANTVRAVQLRRRQQASTRCDGRGSLSEQCQWDAAGRSVRINENLEADDARWTTAANPRHECDSQYYRCTTRPPREGFQLRSMPASIPLAVPLLPRPFGPLRSCPNVKAGIDETSWRWEDCLSPNAACRPSTPARHPSHHSDGDGHLRLRGCVRTRCALSPGKLCSTTLKVTKHRVRCLFLLRRSRRPFRVAWRSIIASSRVRGAVAADAVSSIYLVP